MRRSLVVVFGALLALIGFAVAAGGVVLGVAYATQRDGDGFLTTSTERFTTGTAALVAELDVGLSADDWEWPRRSVGTARLEVRRSDGGAVFAGIGPTDAVAVWLQDASFEEITDITYGPFRTDSRVVTGEDPVPLPHDERFWAATAAGPGSQQLEWDVERGDWTAVVMNGDGSPGVAVDVELGGRFPALVPIALGLGIGGLVVLVGGVVMLTMGLRRTDVDGLAVPSEAPSPVTTGAYPVRIVGRIDDGLGRWQWLVKWFLVIPHVVVLAFLWTAAVVLTVVAGFAILFTGRYPRSIFDFNVGVMRWTWRVSFYAFAALGTDRYPPFTLAADDTYPADLDVDPPGPLSRGLVLVKWWLLALPHYLIVAIFTGGLAFGLGEDGWGAGMGLIAILVLVAAVILAFSGAYPRQLFDLVMGLNRWSYRVLAYALLMTDEYPPFRLDPGGPEPASTEVVDQPPPPPPAPPPPAPDDTRDLEAVGR